LINLTEVVEAIIEVVEEDNLMKEEEEEEVVEINSLAMRIDLKQLNQINITKNHLIKKKAE
jgi:hypothetical protein